MSDHRHLLLDTVGRMLSECCGPDVVGAAEGSWPADLWRVVEAAGLPLAAVDEAAGGGGATVADALTVARLAASYAAPLPLGETGLLAGHLLTTAGLAVPSGPLAAAWTGVEVRLDGGRCVLSGRADRLPWGRVASRIAVLAEGADGLHVCSVEPSAGTVEVGSNVAGEPRDSVVFHGVEIAAGDHARAAAEVTRAALDGRGALLRAAQIAGAITAATRLTVIYAGERQQFGRPIAKFQAVGQQLALLAAEEAAANAAVELALAALDAGRDGVDEIAAAKVRAGEAAGSAAEIAHQVHGAIGFTREHRLHHLTRRLWAWRDEYGSEAIWARRLGERALTAGGNATWTMITDTSRSAAPVASGATT
ncbi:acyl-CoA/acyl-ACP dehydrogenase [Paraconexibacter antarcticus]|uniref:Acyl-CoA/acyl-ACP dehydrogenase n=1 Tax=Paraconexibacter antarcticus TaxID=2949664 RepID=A0ABY5DZ29_9ACTN|nr:acyl-CoA dehydrogenase family protein [Paraconexibacter antarcticus]UTI66209.1 acyl-CoA/acyl-ACP dehydrogenase [Paraconexibacter antarcticus]